MSIEKVLEEKLFREFAPLFLQVENESYMHSSGRGANSHFKFVVVSDKFVGMTKVARHRLVYSLFSDELQQGIHALALHLYSPEEWEKLGKAFPKSPNCLGVGQ